MPTSGADMSPEGAEPSGFEGCPTGTYRHVFGSDTLVWSDEMYEIHGYGRGEVVPTLAMGTSHIVPEQRAIAEGFWAQLTTAGGPVSAYLTIRDSAGAVRRVLTTADVLRDDDGVHTIGIQGLVVDLTRSIHADSHRLANEAVAASALKRSIIEQAKGVLVCLTGVTATEAYKLMNHRSQHVNRKVSAIAQDIMDFGARAGARSGGSTPREDARAFLENF